MKLSIITVNLNNAEGFRKTAESIVSQTFQDFEWIVIDGGSTDGSKELIEQYSDYIAYWCSEKDSGIYNAMNKGVKFAKGEYVLFLNSGDYLVEKSVLSYVLNGKLSGDIIYGNLRITDGEKVIENRKYDNRLSFLFLLKYSIGHPSSFILRELLLITPYDESYKIAADKVFFVKMALAGKRFVHSDCYVSCFDTLGISAKQISIVNEEERRIKRTIVPDSINHDFSRGRYEELMGLKERHPLYSKIITASILFMNWIERHSNKYGK